MLNTLVLSTGLLIYLSSTLQAVYADSEADETQESETTICHFEGSTWVQEVKRRFFIKSRRGRCLMDLPTGLHAIETGMSQENDILIAVHGFKARGGEWVTPLSLLNNDRVDIFYFRWNFLRKQAQARDLFLSELTSLFQERANESARVTIIGHSCGGVLVTSLLSELDVPNPIDVHLVAAPLRGLGIFTVCKPKLPSELSTNIDLMQWRTKKQSDVAFWYLPEDPQDVSLPFNNVVHLPRVWQGRPLGHVNSLEWVAIEMVRQNGERFGTEDFRAKLN